MKCPAVFVLSRGCIFVLEGNSEDQSRKIRLGCVRDPLPQTLELYLRIIKSANFGPVNIGSFSIVLSMVSHNRTLQYLSNLIQRQYNLTNPVSLCISFSGKSPANCKKATIKPVASPSYSRAKTPCINRIKVRFSKNKNLCNN